MSTVPLWPKNPPAGRFYRTRQGDSASFGLLAVPASRTAGTPGASAPAAAVFPLFADGAEGEDDAHSNDGQDYNFKHRVSLLFPLEDERADLVDQRTHKPGDCALHKDDAERFEPRTQLVLMVATAATQGV